MTDGILGKKYVVPPFSYFDTRMGYWNDRKSEWNKLGIRSEIGRETNTISDDSFLRKLGKQYVNNKYRNGYIRDTTTKQLTSTSIFDPVLCEIIYKWFCPINGNILDPFAGGSVRGIVAGYLDYKYVGIDLRKEQVDSNYEQSKEILKNDNVKWIVGDSRNLNLIIEDKYDLIFSCPPYYNLEIYSEDENDLCNAESYDKFIIDYNNIIKQSISKLKDNRFACFVVSDIRDKYGFYYGFVKDTINSFINSGAKLYNEIILINRPGTLPLRVDRMMNNLKVGKSHQNILVFYKGDPKEIQNNFKIKDYEYKKSRSLFDF